MTTKKNNDNNNNVIVPEEVNNADVKIVINMADILQQYQNGMQNSIEYGISLGQELKRKGYLQGGNSVPLIDAGASASLPSFLAIVDKFSYGVYSNPESFDKGKTFYHEPTTEVSQFNTFGDALDWAYNTCCSKNPGKNVPYSTKKNWRNLINNSETDGEGT